MSVRSQAVQPSHSRRAAVMQPYFMPYIGYFQLIAAADVFVIYDDIKYTKKGWINRNRFLRNGADAVFSIPLRKDSDALNIVERQISAEFHRDGLIRQLRAAYQRAPEFATCFPLVERIIACKEENLFGYVAHSVAEICAHLSIATPIIRSSTLAIAGDLRGAERVMAICAELCADEYLNPIGGVELYSPDAFAACGIRLQFIKARLIEYRQFDHPFVPWLSIIDLLMFNPLELVRHWVSREFDLL